jgi:hypothetical protein
MPTMSPDTSVTLLLVDPASRRRSQESDSQQFVSESHRCPVHLVELRPYRQSRGNIQQSEHQGAQYRLVA